MTCYEFGVYFEWTINLFSDLFIQNDLLWDCSWFGVNDILIQQSMILQWLVMRLFLNLSEWLNYLAIYRFKIVCYDIVVDSKWTVELFNDL